MKPKHHLTTYYNSLTEEEKKEFLKQLQQSAAQTYIDNIREQTKKLDQDIDKEFDELFRETTEELHSISEKLEDLSELLSEAQNTHQEFLYDEHVDDLRKITKEQQQAETRREIEQAVEEYKQFCSNKNRIYLH